MSRRRDKPLDIYKRLQVVRSIDDLIYDEDSGTYEKSKAMESDFFQATPVVKKKLNIPVTDIGQDQKYDTDNVFSTFVMPASYVRHIKIMGDEADLTMDYCIEDEDMKWLQNNTKIAADSELKAALTPTMFEKVFDLLEKNTGCGDPVPLQMAISLVSHYMQFPLPLATKMTQELHSYWIAKRAKIHKPLCRKYWPATAPNDTNPHLVFRPREKERYRLRRHHKNDLQSFRKMQSLRREFARARVLLELVLEREMLKKADMEVSGEIFEQHLRNVSAKAGAGQELLVESNFAAAAATTTTAAATEDTSETEGRGKDGIVVKTEVEALSENGTDGREDLPLCYKFRFPHLIPMLEPPKEIDLPLPPMDIPVEEKMPKLKLTLKIKNSKSSKASKAVADSALMKESKEDKASRKRKTKSEGVTRGRKRDRAGLTKDGLLYPEGSVRASKPPPIPKEKKPPKEAKPKKEKEPKEKKEAKEKELAANKKFLTAAQVVHPLGGRISIDSKGRMVLHPNQHGNTKVDASGSSEILLNERLSRMKESMWPTFMDELITREKIYAPRSMSEYMEDLDVCEEEDPPTRFRLRGRIGRGGRVVLDRIPIYDRCHNPESWRSQPNLAASHSSAHSLSNHHDYIYPTTLHPPRQQEHVKLFASHFRQESIYRPGLPHALQSPQEDNDISYIRSEADISSVFPMDKMRIDDEEGWMLLQEDLQVPLTSTRSLPDSSTPGVFSSTTHLTEVPAPPLGSEDIQPIAASSSITHQCMLGGLAESVTASSIPESSKNEGGINIATVGLAGDNTDVDAMDVISSQSGGMSLQNSSIHTPTPTQAVDTVVKQHVCWSPVYSVDEEIGDSSSSCTTFNRSVPNTIMSFPEVHSTAYHAAYRYSDDLTMCPLLLPPERDALFSLPSHREQDLFRLSDQRPRDPRYGGVESDLPFSLQANQLVPREDEASETIISLPKRFTYISKNLGDTSGVSGSSMSESDRRRQSSLSLDNTAGGGSGAGSNSGVDSTLPPSLSIADEDSESTDVASMVESVPVKYVLYV